MKNFTYILLFVLGCYSIAAQTDDKIKGDRNVTIKQTYIDNFNSIIVNGDLPVEIIFNSKASVEVEADDNLHEVIDFQVVDGVLTFNEKIRITSKKKLQIKVNYSESISYIETNGDSEIRSLTSMELGDVSVKANDNSRAYLNINAKTFNYVGAGKSKVRFNIKADSSEIELTDNTKFDALLIGKSSKFIMYQRADAMLEGSSDISEIRLDNSSKFTGNKFVVNLGNLIVETNSDLSIFVKDMAIIEASGSSEVYLYGTPQISLNKFADTAKLQKKE